MDAYFWVTTEEEGVVYSQKVGEENWTKTYFNGNVKHIDGYGNISGELDNVTGYFWTMNGPSNGWYKTDIVCDKISVGGNGEAWAIDKKLKTVFKIIPQYISDYSGTEIIENHIVVKENCNENLVCISATKEGGCWGITDNGEIVYKGPGKSPEWGWEHDFRPDENQNELMKQASDNSSKKGKVVPDHIEAGSNGIVWLLDNLNRVWYKNKLGDHWRKFDNNLSFGNIAASFEHGIVVGYSNQKHLHRLYTNSFDSEGNNKYSAVWDKWRMSFDDMHDHHVVSEPRCITIGSNETTFIVDQNGLCHGHAYDKATKFGFLVPDKMKHLSCM